MRIEPLTAALGAELSDINLAELDAEAAGQLRAAILEYKVVGIRDQFLDDAGHVRLAESLGEPWIHPREGDRVLRRLLVEGDCPMVAN